MNPFTEALKIEQRRIQRLIDLTPVPPGAAEKSNTLLLEARGDKRYAYERFYEGGKPAGKRYLGTLTSDPVREYVQGRFLQQRLARLQYDKALLDQLADQYQDYSNQAIISDLPKSYREALLAYSAENAARMIQQDPADYSTGIASGNSHGNSGRIITDPGTSTQVSSRIIHEGNPNSDNSHGNSSRIITDPGTSTQVSGRVIHESNPNSGNSPDPANACGTGFFDQRYEELRRWASEDYERNTAEFPRSLTYARDGTRVRSKGECIHYNILTDLGLFFRYDVKMLFRDKDGNVKVLCPDFFIQCFDGTFIIIEHLGWLGQYRYAQDFGEKCYWYLQEGYILGKNFFVTSDDLYGGTDSQVILAVDQQVERLFYGF